MKKLIIITGVNKGLGNALFNIFLREENVNVLAISRNLNEVQKKISNGHGHNRVKIIQKDLSKLQNIDEELQLTRYYNSQYEEIIFINNAATISPIDAIGNFKDKSIIDLIHLNTIAPILITNHIVNHNPSQQIKILNISSGAAKRPIIGWSLYCTTKAANEMFFDTLKAQEEVNENIEIHSIDPGVMNTEMQQKIREKGVEVMSNVARFQELYKKNKLKRPEEVAHTISNTYNIL